MGKCAKLLMGHLRDLQTLIDISFVGNSCNLGDMETKQTRIIAEHLDTVLRNRRIRYFILVPKGAAAD